MGDTNPQIEQTDFDIAIIGMAGRFPGASTIEKFWQNLCSGVESITFFSEEELQESGIDPALLKNPNYVKAAALLENPESFDASFFGYSPQEALATDPQQRLFLECAWEALEQAGYDTERCDKAIAVYAGASMNTYFLYSGLIANFQNDELATLIGNDKDFLTTRVSYKLNLRGPSITIGTACSTSLVAVHIACQCLITHECDMALAGGVSVRVPHRAGYLYRQGGITSPDGHCRAFDINAQGTVFGSGAGVVLLKRLSDAIKDRDCIHAVIKGSAINNDGSGKVGYTAPSVNGQSDVILEALTNAGVKADTISYIETHGTATALGDPIEVTALTSAFRNHTSKKGFCALGSVKTNIGHLDAAAGVAGLIKTVMALKYKMIPPSLHFTQANPEIDFANNPFYVNTELSNWKTDGELRRAGVSSFGVGGTNAHVILEEAPDIETSETTRAWQLLLLSTKTDTAMEAATTDLVEYLKRHKEQNLADVAYTLQIGRKVFNHRRMLVCRDIDDAVNTLAKGDPKRVLDSVKEKESRNVAFIFSGQGAQYVNMGRELYESEPVFREQMDRCAEILGSHLRLDMLDIIYPDGSDIKEATQEITQTNITQPALFTIEYALAKLWMSWGVNPAVMVGHSIGEYVAACLAGVFSLEDALSIVAARGRLMQALPGGSMMAVFLPEDEIQPLLNDKLSLAVINGPSLCVVSGEKEAVADLEKQLSQKNVSCRYLHTSHAFHSKMIEPMLKAFTEHIKRFKLNAPRIPFVSNLSGTWVTPNEATNPAYWAKQTRETVRFSECLQELFKEPNRVLLEVGPGSTFSALAKQHPDRKTEQVVLASTRHPKEERSDVAYILNTFGQLWLAGIKIDWDEFYRDEPRNHVPLPTYSFERKRYWIEQKEKPWSQQVSPAELSAIMAGIDQPIKPESAAASVDSRDQKSSKKDARVTSADEYERIISEIWVKLLGVKKISVRDNYFDLGGSSLMAVRLFSEIERILGKKLPLSTLYQAPTIEMLAHAVREEKFIKPWKSLVQIQPSGSKPPLFLIHAAGGNILIYHDLVRYLGSEQPIYGLQSQGLDGELPFHTRIEDMASQYLQDIQEIQPNGPYLLAGYCMGGKVALEMAQYLKAQGEEVALLVFFETYNSAGRPSTTFLENIYYYLQKIQFNAGKLWLSKNKLAFMLAKLKVIWRTNRIWLSMISARLSPVFGPGKSEFTTLYNLRQNNHQVSASYVPKSYPGRIIHFVPAKEYAQHIRPEVNWEKLAIEGVEIYQLPTYPAEMFKEPYVELLAEKMKICITRALEKEPSNKV